MPNYVGFSTIGSNKPKSTNAPPGFNGGPGSIVDSLNTGRKFRLTETSCVIRDLLNAINIRQGEKVGQPEYGSKVWDFIFEPNTADVQTALESELRRIISQDPRLQIGYIRIFPQENGILVEIQVAVYPFNQAQVLNVFFNSNTTSATLQE